MNDPLSAMSYESVTAPAEDATDLVFTSPRQPREPTPRRLERLLERFLEHGSLHSSAMGVMTFRGRRLFTARHAKSPLSRPDARLFTAPMNGGHALHGITNRHLGR